jgi:hypothetical protein
VSTTRREVLGVAALAVAAPLGGNGSAAADAELLAYLLRVQELESALYREGLQAVPGLARADRRLLGELREHEVAHVDGLRATLRDAGGRAAARVPPAFGAALASPAALLKLANTLEDTAVSALNGAVPLLSSPDLRTAVVATAGAEARHAALVRVRRGAPPAPLAFDRDSPSYAVRAKIRAYEQR